MTIKRPLYFNSLCVFWSLCFAYCHVLPSGSFAQSGQMHIEADAALASGRFERPPVVHENAALFYYTAVTSILEELNYILGAEVSDADGTDVVEVEQWLSVPLGEIPRARSQDHLAFFAASIEKLHQSQSRSYCDWEYSNRPFTFSPDLIPMKRLAMLICVQSRLHTAERDFDSALTVLRTNLVLRKHLCSGPTEYHVLVGTQIGRMTLSCLRELIQQPDSPNIYWYLASLDTNDVGVGNVIEQLQRDFFGAIPLLEKLEIGVFDRDQMRALDDQVSELQSEYQFEVDSEWDIQATAVDSLYSDARRELIERGFVKEDVDGMTPKQVVLMQSLWAVRQKHNELLKWSLLPFHLAHGGFLRAETEYAEAFVELDSILTGGLITRVSSPSNFSVVWSLSVNVERQLKQLMVVEAFRDSVARTGDADFKSATLHLPLPFDPGNGESFQITFENKSLSVVGLEFGELEPDKCTLQLRESR